jgi:hypothetical protein
MKLTSTTTTREDDLAELGSLFRDGTTLPLPAFSMRRKALVRTEKRDWVRGGVFRKTDHWLSFTIISGEAYIRVRGSSKVW